MPGYHNHYNDNSFQRGYHGIDWDTKKAVEELRKKGEHVLEAAKQALEEGAKIIVADMQRRVPVRTGRLRNSIFVDPDEDYAAYEFTANARNPRDNFLYGQIVEFSEWVKFKGKKRKKKKKAFMYPALAARREEVNKMVKDAINQAIERGS